MVRVLLARHGKQAANIQSQCEKCQHIPNHEESCAMFSSNDWQISFLEYLIKGVLPNNRDEAYRLKRMATRYFVEGGILFQKGFNRKPLRCLGTPEAQSIMQEVHVSECGNHQGKKRLLQQLLNLAYFWPTMKQDIANHVKTCDTCQLF